MPLTKLLIFCYLLLISTSVTAGVISYAGYYHDDSTNVVLGGGLEWLQWDETPNQSISTALANYSGEGWRLANNQEMAELFNSFELAPDYIFDSEEETEHNIFLYDSTGITPHSIFIEIFGDTLIASGETVEFRESAALYGLDENNNGLYNLGFVADGGAKQIVLSSDIFSKEETGFAHGVALVRSASVSEPSTPILLVLGLAGLVVIGRRLKL